MVRLRSFVFSCAIASLGPAWATGEDPVQCLRGIRLARLGLLEQNGKRATSRVYFPDGHPSGTAAELVVYFHGFDAKPESLEQGGLRRSLIREYERLGVEAPIFLSFSYGPRAIAGIEAHGADHAHFIPAVDFWNALLEELHSHQLPQRSFSFLGNSGGAFNAFQMLRNIPAGIRVPKFVAASFPNFLDNGFAPNPSLQAGGDPRDPTGTEIRRVMEPLIQGLTRDPWYTRLLPMNVLVDGSLSRDTRILIHGAQWDALGYTTLNRQFVQRARALGYAIDLNEIPNVGHAQSHDNRETVRFIVSP